LKDDAIQDGYAPSADVGSTPYPIVRFHVLDSFFEERDRERERDRESHDTWTGKGVHGTVYDTYRIAHDDGFELVGVGLDVVRPKE
jgi:hypothetical protein